MCLRRIIYVRSTSYPAVALSIHARSTGKVQQFNMDKYAQGLPYLIRPRSPVIPRSFTLVNIPEFPVRDAQFIKSPHQCWGVKRLKPPRLRVLIPIPSLMRNVIMFPLCLVRRGSKVQRHIIKGKVLSKKCPTLWLWCAIQWIGIQSRVSNAPCPVHPGIHSWLTTTLCWEAGRQMDAYNLVCWPESDISNQIGGLGKETL